MKLSGKNNSHMIDLLFSLALFCVFAASALMVVLIGAQVYQNTVERMNQSFDGRASLSYVTNKLRQNDRPGAVHIVELRPGVTALALDQEFDGVTYQTIIYHYDGALREVFVEKDSDFGLENGQAIVRIGRFEVEQTADGLYSIVAEDRLGNASSTTVAIRCS